MIMDEIVSMATKQINTSDMDYGFRHATEMISDKNPRYISLTDQGKLEEYLKKRKR